MKIFDCKELHNLVKKVVVEKLIYKCGDTFTKRTSSAFHFLSYNEMIEVCAVLVAYTGICNIKQHEEYGTLYCFNFIYDKNDFMAIAEQAFYINDCDCSNYTFKVVFVDENDTQDEDNIWYPIFLVREFWEFCENFINRNKKENEENMNDKTTETKEETLSNQDIHKLITNWKEFKKIIEGMENIGFTNETIYETILSLIDKLN